MLFDLYPAVHHPVGKVVSLYIIPNFNDLWSNLVTTSYKKRPRGTLIIFALLIFSSSAGRERHWGRGGEPAGVDRAVSVAGYRVNRSVVPQQDMTDPDQAVEVRRTPRTHGQGTLSLIDGTDRYGG